ncbi:MAG: ribosome silencing factor [Desulfobulbaceae bacterium]|uniref:Ribosomal silencing factor RsfS n=1 Tax=Candidatus Desulfatifera sulfidica TaxID=2841691 RepID=A0A8J6N8C1_9BACT|nr:ribosome silencing factor [Candidatus Desulfatifera sulfidica]
MQAIKKEHREKSGQELATILAQAALDHKAEDLLVIDVRGRASFADFFVIMSGRSTRHVQGLAETLEAEVRSKRVNMSKAEGLQEGNWVLLDFGDVIVHIFYHEQRSFYDLEGLWHNAPRIEIEQ